MWRACCHSPIWMMSRIASNTPGMITTNSTTLEPRSRAGTDKTRRGSHRAPSRAVASGRITRTVAVRDLLELDAIGFRPQLRADGHHHGDRDEGQAGGEDHPGDDLTGLPVQAPPDAGRAVVEGGGGEQDQETQWAHRRVLPCRAVRCSEREDLISGRVDDQ